MATRVVTDTLLRGTGLPYANEPVSFYLREGAFTESATYPPDRVDTTTDSNGAYSQALWVNSDGLTPSEWVAIYPNKESIAFVLPPGASAITMAELRAQAAWDWYNDPVPTAIDLERARYANTANSTLGSALIGYLPSWTGAAGRALRSRLQEVVYLTDFTGGVADNATDIGPAMANAVAALAAGGTIVVPASATNYYWATTVTFSKPLTIWAYGAIFRLSSGGKIRAHAGNVKVLGSTFQLVPAAGTQASGNVFATKNTDTGDIAQHNTGWEFRDCIFHNVTLRYQKLGRISTRTPLLWTSLSTAITAGQLVLPVTSAASFTTLMHARCLLETWVIEYRPITAVDTVSVPNTITIGGGGFSVGAPEGRHITAATQANGAHGAVSVLNVDTGTVFTDGQYAQVLQTDGSTHISLVTSHTATTVTLTTPLTVGCADNTSVIPVNNGQTNTGTDIAGRSKIINCEFKHYRGNYACELGGIEDVEVAGCHWHDIVRYVDPNSALYGTEASGTDASLINSTYGECLKITANSRLVNVHDDRFARFARNGIDLYAGGGASIRGNIATDGLGLYSSFIEMKWKSSDTTLPEPISVSDNQVYDMPGYGMVCGTPNATLKSNIIRRSGYSGLYLNGAKDAIADDDTAELRNYTDAVTVQGNIVTDNAAGSGILVTEVTNASLTANVLMRNFYNIFLHEKSARIAVIGNICRDHQASGQDIRIAGHASVDSQHEVWGNITDSMTGAVQLFDANADYVVQNGYGEEAAGAGNPPTASKWPVGVTVRNSSDNTFWKRTYTTMVKLALG